MRNEVIFHVQLKIFVTSLTTKKKLRYFVGVKGMFSIVRLARLKSVGKPINYFWPCFTQREQFDNSDEMFSTLEPSIII